MKAIKLICGLLFLSCGIAHAAPATSSIPLTGGTLNPNSSFSVSLAPLIGNIKYDVNCTIISSAKDNDPINVKFGSTDELSGVKLNGKLTMQGPLKGGINQYVALGAVATTGDSALTFQNLDLSNSATIDHCIAIPSTLSK